MDLGTIGSKLQRGQYQTMEDVKKDLELIFSNCRQFNPPATFPITCAEAVEKVLKREWPKAMERKLSGSEKRALQGILSTIIKEPVYVFSFPYPPSRGSSTTGLGFSESQSTPFFSASPHTLTSSLARMLAT